jgi:hypothetical protein
MYFTKANCQNYGRCMYKSILKFSILAVPYQYILSLINLTVRNGEIFQMNSFAHSINKRIKHRLHTHNMPTFHIFRKV